MRRENSELDLDPPHPHARPLRTKRLISDYLKSKDVSLFHYGSQFERPHCNAK